VSSFEESNSIHNLVDHLFRHRAGQMVASLTRIFGLANLDLVEDAVQESLLRALRIWPFEGIPKNPTAWLIQVAKNLILDRTRRSSTWQTKQDEITAMISDLEKSASAPGPAFAREVRDDQLQLIFACCHPSISRDDQIALTLKTVSGFSIDEVARAFLSKKATMAQRIVRAKRSLREQNEGLRIPPPRELNDRLEAVLQVLYLVFNEGYCAHTGDDLVRSDLCFEAIRLVELLTHHPSISEPKVRALAALFLLQAARLPTRTDFAGDLLLLSEQDRSLWDRSLLNRGLTYLGQSASGSELSAYHLQAEIACCHATAESLDTTDWHRILSCYDALLNLNPSPVIALNRTIALAKVQGPEAGLEALDAIASHRVLQNYYPLWATRGEFLLKLERGAEAAQCYETALNLTSSRPMRRFLRRRLEHMVDTATSTQMIH
jgi:RNA polymerase sigma-70 factor (ECF subfamily)